MWVAVGLLAAGIVAAIALSGPAAPVGTEIGNDELVRLKGQGALIVDVRTPSEFEGSHIPGAINAPMDQIQQTAATWDKDREIVLYCATGARSANVLAYLEGQGFTKVHNLTQGLVAWTGETVSGQGAVAEGGAPGAIETSGKPLFIEFSSST